MIKYLLIQNLNYLNLFVDISYLNRIDLHLSQNSNQYLWCIRDLLWSAYLQQHLMIVFVFVHLLFVNYKTSENILNFSQNRYKKLSRMNLRCILIIDYLTYLSQAHLHKLHRRHKFDMVFWHTNIHNLRYFCIFLERQTRVEGSAFVMFGSLTE